MLRNVYIFCDVAALAPMLNAACRKCGQWAASIPPG
jgi:hypothetical protein